MRKMACIMFALVVIEAADAHPQVFSSGALPQTLIGSWQHGSYIVPSVGGTTLYGNFDGSADFVAAQWDNPVSDLTSFGSVSCTGNFAGYSSCYQATSPNITDTFGTDGSSVQWIDSVSTGGSTLPCLPAAKAELDSFLAANGPYAGYNHSVKINVHLNAVAHLYARVSVNPVAFTVNSSRCATTQSAVLLSFTFNDATAKQTLFYQIQLAAYPSLFSSGFFANSNPYGYRDNIFDGYGQFSGGVPTAQVTALTIDVLPRISSIISGATNGLDTTVAHWQTGSTYVGQNLWGDMQTETLWSAYSYKTQ